MHAVKYSLLIKYNLTTYICNSDNGLQGDYVWKKLISKLSVWFYKPHWGIRSSEWKEEHDNQPLV